MLFQSVDNFTQEEIDNTVLRFAQETDTYYAYASGLEYTSPAWSELHTTWDALPPADEEAGSEYHGSIKRYGDIILFKNYNGNNELARHNSISDYLKAWPDSGPDLYVAFGYDHTLDLESLDEIEDDVDVALWVTYYQYSNECNKKYDGFVVEAYNDRLETGEASERWTGTAREAREFIAQYEAPKAPNQYSSADIHAVRI